MLSRISNVSGWVGVVALQLASLPTLFRALFIDGSVLPPLDMVLLLFVGMLTMGFNAVYNRILVHSLTCISGTLVYGTILGVILL